MRTLCTLLSACLLLGTAGAQATPPEQPGSPQTAPVPGTPATPAMPAATAAAATPAADLSSLLPPIEQQASAIRLDLARLRIERWKTDSNTKKQTQDNAASLDRNLAGALPVLVGEVRSAPTDLAAGLKLYRDLNALYDVMSSLVESAGAFGTQDEFNTLAADINKLDDLRRSFADALVSAAVHQQTQMTQLENQLRSAQAAAAAAVPPLPPKKIVIDDTEPAKKAPVTHKKKAKPASPPAAPAQPAPH